MNNAYLLIGGNMGDRMEYLRKAIVYVEQCCGHIVQRSPVYSTAAWGLQDQPDFYNQALHLQTEMEASQLMQELLQIEKTLGRIRNEKLGPRVIDIDILLFDHQVIDIHDLQVPHPRMHLRRFVLEPLNEIAPDIIHPIFQKDINTLLQECTDELDVHKI